MSLFSFWLVIDYTINDVTDLNLFI